MMQRDGVFIVSGRFMIQRDSPPTIRQKPYGISALRNHWFDRYTHAVLQQHTISTAAIIRNSWIFMHGTPDSMSDELPDDSKAFRLAMSLDGIADVADPVTGDGLLYPFVESFLGGIQK